MTTHPSNRLPDPLPRRFDRLHAHRNNAFRHGTVTGVGPLYVTFSYTSASGREHTSRAARADLRFIRFDPETDRSLWEEVRADGD